ncbi:MAG: DUF4080 domain-containing protein [Kiritimatiellia bacterium]
MPAPSILLVAINARYGHCAFAARSLLANLGALRGQAAILETDLDVQPFQLAAEVVTREPQVAGFSVYLWNTGIVRETLAILRQVAPRLRIVLGGPEITSEHAAAWNGLADWLVVGEGETAFREVCEGVVAGGHPSKSSTDEEGEFQHPTFNVQHPTSKGTSCVILAKPEELSQLSLPYDLYTDQDIAHRTIFVESSRGCPFSCAYCTSSGTGLRLTPLERLLPALDLLLARGVRAFRFLDRSLNASESQACGLLDFFLARYPARLQLHFEIMPCRLNEPLRQRLAAFPPGVLHLEVGVQTLNEAVARNIGRTVANDTVLETLEFLAHGTRSIVHADLIFGLPGEDEASFAAGFDRLVRAFDFPELQVNLLKRLPGTLLARDARFAGLVFSRHPPYELLASDVLDFADLIRLQQFARCWELIHNRGHFAHAAALLQPAGDASPFRRYQALAAHIHAAEGRLYALGRERLSRHVAQFLEAAGGVAEEGQTG